MPSTLTFEHVVCALWTQVAQISLDNEHLQYEFSEIYKDNNKWNWSSSQSKQ